ncbi:MAG: MarR family winged helix-turn-helix transcriptional regulator, partial [Gammaproteobacteria bacterium]
MAQSDLANQLDLGKVALGGLVDRLEIIGLVKRRADTTDRRVKRISLTPAGRTVVSRMRKIATSANADILNGIRAQDVEATARTLKLIKANLVKMVNGDFGGSD